MAKGTQYSKQFKEDAVRYRKDHPELTVQKAAENLGISESALKDSLKRELRDTKDALEILKKAIGILGK